MKRTLSFLLASVFMLLCGGCQVRDPHRTDPDTLTVGMSDAFCNELMVGWENTAENAAVRRLIHAGSPIAFTKEGTFTVNTSIVETLDIIPHTDGGKTFRVKLKEGLRFSDGSPLTAKDYVFALLLYASPQFASLGADTRIGADLVGYDTFHTGKSRSFAGVHPESEYTFSLDVAADRFPYYHELSFLEFDPLPMSVIAPNITLRDDGGACLDGMFSEAVLQKTILDPENGYRYAPAVSTGPYRFVRYDREAKKTLLVKNEYFAGSYDGVIPSIERLVLHALPNSERMEALSSGTVDLLTQVTDKGMIDAGLTLAETGKIAYKAYPHDGYGKLSFACNFGPTQFAAVRQAIAYCLDREKLIETALGGFAVPIDGCYSLSGWEYRENEAELLEKLTHYRYDPDKAKALLIEDGWTLSAVGEAYVEGHEQVRHKLIDGTLMPLVVNLATLNDSPISEQLAAMLTKEVSGIGMRMSVAKMEFPKLMENLRQDHGQQHYHIYHVATDLTKVQAVWYYYHPDLMKYGGTYNLNFIADEALFSSANELKATAPDDRAGYLENWLTFQLRWNELLPDLPLYVQTEHDFFNTRLTNYAPDGMFLWDQAILYAKLQEQEQKSA